MTVRSQSSWIAAIGKNITILAATKERSVEEIRKVTKKIGITVIGENRVQELLKKLPDLPKNLRIDFIGHLQKNKVKKIIRICELIHSVDSVELAEKINREAVRIGKIQKILLEVNIAGDPKKFGFTEKSLIKSYTSISKLKNIKVEGLMTVAPDFPNPEETRPIFRKLRKLRDSLKLKELSMGMSNDYKIAIEEGATIIRLGRILFST